MELIVIGENRLKIMLTGEDMAHYELGDPYTEEIAPHTREVLRHIFADAHAEVGFDTEGERLFVQLYASKGGGCEIFVTKLESTGEARLLQALRGRGEGSDMRANRVVWLRIRNLEDTAALCRRLVAVGYNGESSLYIDGTDGGFWYLSLTVSVTREGAVPYPFLWEYGEEVTGEVSLYLAEYGREICGTGAVERMMEM